MSAITDRARCLTVAKCVANHEGVSLFRLLRKSKGVLSGRKRSPKFVTLYLCNIVFDIPKARVARALNYNKSSVNIACRRIEDRRDDPKFDAYLTALEDELRGVGCRRIAA